MSNVCMRCGGDLIITYDPLLRETIVECMECGREFTIQDMKEDGE